MSELVSMRTDGDVPISIWASRDSVWSLHTTDTDRFRHHLGIHRDDEEVPMV